MKRLFERKNFEEFWGEKKKQKTKNKNQLQDLIIKDNNKKEQPKNIRGKYVKTMTEYHKKI